MSKHSFIDLLDIEIIRSQGNQDKNTSIGQIRLQEHHSQVYGNAHGGVIYSLADTVAGYLIWKNANPEVDLINTIEMKMNYLAPAPIGGIIQAVATLKHLGRSTGVCLVDIFYMKETLAEITDNSSKNKKLVATGIATFTKIKKETRVLNNENF
jgi:acyl-CoA thioesterase